MLAKSVLEQKCVKYKRNIEIYYRDQAKEKYEEAWKKIEAA